MSKEQQQQEFDLGFTPEQIEGINPNQGQDFRPPMFGDYTLEIAAMEQQASQGKGGKQPHVMSKVTFRIVKAHDKANDAEIETEIPNCYYAGSPQSPPYMQARLKALMLGAQVIPTKAGLKASMFIGKRLDATVTWELSKGDKLDDFGQPKFYVNARVKGERKVGEERPKDINPAAESARAHEYRTTGKLPEGMAGGAGETPAWEQTGGTAGGTEAAGGGEGTGFIPESDVDAVAMLYRAVYQIGGDQSADAKEALLGIGVDPDGKVNLDMIEDADVKKEYLEKFPQAGGTTAKKTQLPALGNAKPRTGQRQPRA